MILYLIIALVLFFVGLFAAARLRKKYDLYRQHERFQVVVLIGLLSIFWVVVIPVSLVLGLLSVAVYLSTSLLKRFEK